jgi:hypothetical protein
MKPPFRLLIAFAITVLSLLLITGAISLAIAEKAIPMGIFMKSNLSFL